MSVRIIHRLDSISRSDLGVAGGKGSNLGELIRLGFPVPPGFVVSAAAYAEQVRVWGLAEALAPHVEAKAWELAANEAAKIFEGGSLLPEIETGVREACRDLGAARVAVRSSATAEDLVDASFAGQHETYLDILGENEVLLALRRCWASLWSSRALAYRDARKIEHVSVHMAVVVQQMAPADFAGVLFTVDPVAQRADRMLIEVVPGLGEALVSGHAIGDVIRLEREPRVVSLPVRTDKLFLIERERRDPHRPIPQDDQLLELGRMALKLEAHFGTPQDVEFAIVQKKIFLLQSRPITTLESADIELIPAPPPLSRMQKKMTADVGNDRFPKAPKPLDQWGFRIMASVFAKLGREMGFSVDTVQDRHTRENIWFEFFLPPIGKPTLRVLGLPGKIAKSLQKDWLAWWETDAFPRLMQVSAPVDLRSLEDTALLARADRIEEVFVSVILQRFQGTSAQAAMIALGPLVSYAVGKKRKDIAIADLLSGIHTRTSEVNLALYDLAQKAKHLGEEVIVPIRQGRPEDLQQSEIGRSFLQDVDAFLDEHGHRESVGIFLTEPTWRTDPKPCWGALKGLLEATHPPSEAVGQKRYEATLEEITKKLGFIPGLANKFRSIVELVRRNIVFRERTHFDIVRSFSAFQAITTEMGRRLEKRGFLQSADDIAYLRESEARGWLQGQVPAMEEAHKLVKRRRATYRVVNGRWQKNMFREPVQSENAPNELKGVGASSGVVRARARVIRDENEFARLQVGEILVCRYTNPAWTPLFTIAAGVVTDIGGAVSHAAIVAREYGLPAVLGALGATERIKDGDEILIDGATGIVTIVQKAPAMEVSIGG